MLEGGHEAAVGEQVTINGRHGGQVTITRYIVYYFSRARLCRVGQITLQMHLVTVVCPALTTMHSGLTKCVCPAHLKHLD